MAHRGRHVKFALTVSLALALQLGCTDVALQPTPPPPLTTFDNLLRVRGEFCAQPNTTVVFPVKVLFVLDQSASLQCTDAAMRRYPALNSLIGELRMSPSTTFGFIGFSSWTRRLTDAMGNPGFTRDMAQIAPFLDPAAGLGPATDYQGALALAIQYLEHDMQNTSGAERARTRYVVVMVTDGVPEPRCNAGCEDDEMNCSDGDDNDGDGDFDAADSDCANIMDNSIHPDNLYAVCNRSRMEIDEAYPPTAGESYYSDFSGVCPSYNQPPQIMARVADLIALEDTYSTGQVSLNTVLLFASQADAKAACGPVDATFGYDQVQARALLTGMANAGRGVFRDANVTAIGDTFLDFDFRSLEAEELFTGFQVVNVHARQGETELEPDTDTDGLPDMVEFNAGLNPMNRDSDQAMGMPAGDDYGDLVETRMADVGFDPLDPTSPAVPCSETRDNDGDGLIFCEEVLLETDPFSADSDGDHMLDWLEVLNGTEPTRNDAFEDLDFDGLTNIDETLAATDPARPDARFYREHRVTYDVVDLGERMIPNFHEPARGTELRHCYSFDARNIRMVATPVPGERGLNRILMYAQEEPAQLAGAQAQLQVACFEAFYLGPSSKSPESGVIDASPDGWEAQIDALQTRIDTADSCAWFTAPVTRAMVESAVMTQLTEPIRLGRFGYSRMAIVQMLQRYFAADAAIRLPRPASELFVPVETFDPAIDCFRPWEMERLHELFDLIATQCSGGAAP